MSIWLVIVLVIGTIVCLGGYWWYVKRTTAAAAANNEASDVNKTSNSRSRDSDEQKTKTDAKKSPASGPSADKTVSGGNSSARTDDSVNGK